MKISRLALSLLFVLACGGDDSTPNLNGVADIPSLDASEYDYSLNDAVQGLGKVTPNMQTQVGEFSRAACEAYTLKKQLFRDSKEIDSFRCYIKKLEQANIGMRVPFNEWAYYNIQFPPKDEGENGPPEFVHIRIGKFARELRMDVCQPVDNTFRREAELRFSPMEGGYKGHVVSRSNYTDDRGEASTGRSRIDVEIVGTSAENFTSADFRVYRKESRASDVDHGWISKMSFDADEGTKTNTLTGANAFSDDQFDSNGGKTFGKWGNSPKVGSVKFLSSGTHRAPTQPDCEEWHPNWGPDELGAHCIGWCYNEDGEQEAATDGKCHYEHSGTESFSIANNDPPPPTFTVIANGESPHFTEVSEETLPTLDDVESHLGWTQAWDCSGNFRPIDATGQGTVIAVCENSHDQEFWRICEEQERAAKDL